MGCVTLTLTSTLTLTLMLTLTLTRLEAMRVMWSRSTDLRAAAPSLPRLPHPDVARSRPLFAARLLACGGLAPVCAHERARRVRAPDGARAAYYGSVGAGALCYLLARRANFVHRNLSASAWWHCGLHAAGNAGNMLLYDSLGQNWLGWARRVEQEGAG